MNKFDNKTSKFELLDEHGRVVRTASFYHFHRTREEGRKLALDYINQQADGWEHKAPHVTGKTSIREV